MTGCYCRAFPVCFFYYFHQRSIITERQGLHGQIRSSRKSRNVLISVFQGRDPHTVLLLLPKIYKVSKPLDSVTFQIELPLISLTVYFANVNPFLKKFLFFFIFSEKPKKKRRMSQPHTPCRVPSISPSALDEAQPGKIHIRGILRKDFHRTQTQRPGEIF